MKPRRQIALAMFLLAGCGASPATVGLEPEPLTQRCAFCHGVDGISPNPIWPSLAGLDAAYLEKVLVQFSKGAGGGRSNAGAAQMHAISAALSDEEKRRIAAYYATRPAAAWEPAPGPGAELYREGAGDIAACAGCHGASGEGMAELAAPRIAGQSARYIAGQLYAYADGKRDDAGSGMAAVARAMTKGQIAAVAEFLSHDEGERK